MIRRLLIFLLCAASLLACTHPTKTIAPPDSSNYPADVAKIFVNKCATTGCHNQASYQNAAGLLLDSWDHLLQGSNSGAEVVAYSTTYSSLLYYVNTDSSLGTIVADPGHLKTPLSHDEYMTLYNWIAAGAPDKSGNIPFAANSATRQKIYLTIQGCDLIAVIDAKSRLVMRYIPIGNALNQAPHDVEISADGRYAYVPFYAGRSVQRVDMQADTVTGSVDLTTSVIGGAGQWSIVMLSPNDTAFMVSNWSPNGSVVAVNTSAMQRNPMLSVDILTGGTDLFPSPHGLAANATFDTFIATLQNDLIKYAFDPAGGISYHKTIAATGQPHQIQMTPDYSKYFVTCPDPSSPSTNTVRVYDAHSDSLLKIFTVGTLPQEMDISPSKGYIFVACMEDQSNPQVNRRGSVYVIDYNTLAIVKVIYGDFFQPHDVTVDEQDGLVFIPSRNADPAGPAPHHATSCGGRPGWYSVYDLNTLAPADNKRYDVPTDPYAISTRFK